MSAHYDPQQPPPPGQGYYSGRPNAHHEPPRHRQSRDGSISPRSGWHDPFAGQRQQPGNFQDNYQQPYDPRRYSEAPAEDFQPPNQLAPYDEEKAFAEWNRVYGPESAYAASNAPTPAPVPVPAPQPARRHARRRSLESSRRHYDDDMDSYDDRSIDRRPRPRRHRPRRHDSTHSVSDYQGKPETKDLAPTLMASAAGAFLGRKMVSKGALGIVGGAIAGALGANAGEHFDERKRRKESQLRNEGRRESEDRYYRERDEDRYYREREEDRRRSRRTRSPVSVGARSEIRDDETLPPPPRRGHRERDLSRPARSKRYAASSPDSRMSV